MLAPGTSQVYYGDESARSLIIEGTQGDATLRSFMNWKDINENPETKAILTHYQKLGQFRAKHPAVGAGTHQMISKSPYVFSRSFSKGDFLDLVVIGLDLSEGEKIMDASSVFNNGNRLHDAYSNQDVIVENGTVKINSNFTIVLLENGAE
ncbi:hypothetical protein ACFSKN_08155 [Mariniflexile gromovii]|uniref:Uncharacterized protein n=1 Tax=Mariniflexile gromovii TaxID=362523 RepID=A0ABS4BUE2_9FLAO|nr:hypothetical protein [Mariniflexile gromovii]MBP0904176.1 hypothetical protein [Mariniflexile gromovii]